MKSCGKYAPLIYSASLSYNPLKEENLNISEIFHEIKDGTSNSSQEETYNHKGDSETNTNGKSTTTGSSNSTSTSDSSSLNVASDTPQGQISKDEILQGKWASSTSASESESKVQDSTSSSSNNNLENKDVKSETAEDLTSGKVNSKQNEVRDYERIKKGYDLRKTKSELIAEYRKNIYNIYEAIVNDLNPLFFALY